MTATALMDEDPEERRKREEAAAKLWSSMPGVENLMKEIAGQQRYMTEIGKVFSKQYQQMFKDMVPKLDLMLPKFDIVVPKIDIPIPKLVDIVPKFEIPTLKLDYSTLFPDFAALSAKTVEALKPSLDLIHDLQRDQFAELLASVGKTIRSLLPPNWRDDSISIPSDLEILLLDEGLPLAWVPPTDVLALIFRAQNAAERRKVVGTRWKRIVQACVAELDRVSDPRLKGHVRFARAAAEPLLEGHWKSSQALSANLLDSILRKEFNGRDRKRMTDQTSRPSIDDYPLRLAMVLGAIWAAHGQYWPDQGDKVPRKFSRHGSAHGVSHRQYSRINAVLALMHVTSLLRLLDTDLA
jgi:hypothetical protein